MKRPSTPAQTTLFVLLALIVLPAVAQLRLTRALPGQWSSGAHYLWPGPTAIADAPAGGRDIDLISPDRSHGVRVGDANLRPYRTDAPADMMGIPFATQSLAELLWSPTSDAFAVTESDGGWVGTWGFTVYRIQGRSVVATRPTQTVMADFRRRYPHCPDEQPNLAAVGWDRGSAQLSVIAEMPCHGGCADMCAVRGYVIETGSGRILETLDAASIRRDWAQRIGPRLRTSGR